MLFNTNGIWRGYGPGKSKNSMNIGTFRGNPSISVFIEGQNKPIRFALTQPVIYLMKRYLLKLIDAGPNTRFSISRTSWNPETKQSDPQATMVLGKDDKNMIHIDIKDKVMSEPARFYLTIPKSVSTGEEMDDATRSKIAVAALIERTLDGELMMANMLSRDAEDMKASAQRRDGGGGGYNRSNSSVGSDDMGGSDGSLF